MPPSSPSGEVEPSLRLSVKENVKQVNIKVYQTLLVKHIRQNPDGQLTLIGTIIQRCVKPLDLESSQVLQFKYRVNDELFVTESDSGRVRNVRVKDEDSLTASVGTYRVGIPLSKHALWHMYPFRIRYCKAKIELSTSEIDGVTYRPDLHYNDGEPTSFVTIKKEEDLDMMAEYDMMTHNPFVYGEAQNKGKETFYTPIVYVGFYLMDPVILTLINTFLPIILVLVLLAATVFHEEDKDTCLQTSIDPALCVDGEPMDGADYVTQLTGISLTAVFLLPMLRSTDAARTSIQVVDLFIMLVFGGIVVSALGTVYIKLRKYGCLISWLSLLIPLVGKFSFDKISRKLSRMDNLKLIKPNESPVTTKKRWYHKLDHGFCCDEDTVESIVKQCTPTHSLMRNSFMKVFSQAESTPHEEGSSSTKGSPKTVKAKGEVVYVNKLVPFTDRNLKAKNGEFLDTHWGFTPKMVEKGESTMGIPRCKGKSASESSSGNAVSAIPSAAKNPLLGKPDEMSLHSLEYEARRP
mmetsp:Transcript_12797/g.21722  ORF Transcript_12797/g.21722 Transcript_12797/m.21722 type:complete len:521 (+) Transcript_12797:134-1696(+)|eukprot:CAMPEP_0198217698 /NCGR_PEP_ID=MMETSP1445-20131203/65342_1 /TAXON_ID=36898 /ORGANISM="Pyramimonas sp., Strain CCMP2087" /LENGTH=520 /DNA_ID=CAMNT_0043894483 /DNA_START=95 /DNA_END=1657 /DNA_ORIENTATION=-